MGPRHLLLLRSDGAFIWGFYYFVLEKIDSPSEELKIPLMLPKETLYVETGEGLQKEHLKKKGGKYQLQGSFSGDSKLLSLGFKLKTCDTGPSPITLELPYPIQELVVASPLEAQLQLKGKGDAFSKAINGGGYHSLQSQRVFLAGERLQIEVHGIPQGRNRLWMWALMFAAVLALSSILLTLRSDSSHSKRKV